MTLERWPVNREICRLRIADIQRALWYLAIYRANMPAFSGDTVPDPEEQQLAISPTTTPAGFWNHFIGGPIAAADVQFQIAEATDSPIDHSLVRTIQKRVGILASRWMKHPNGRGINQLGGNGITRAFQAAACSFDWSEHPDLFQELRVYACTLADVYMELEGKRSL